MASCGSLQHLFENLLLENPTLLESLATWKQIRPNKPVEPSSFTEIFGELHFKEMLNPSPLLLPPPTASVNHNPHPTIESDDCGNANDENHTKHSLLDSSLAPPKIQYKGGSKNSESLQLCTEGLGFESSDDVEDLRNVKAGGDWRNHDNGNMGVARHFVGSKNSGSWEAVGGGGRFKRSRIAGAFPPPPITSMGSKGKPGFFFRSYRQDGRFIIKEVKVPSLEFLHACREDGRLKLQFVVPEEDDEDDEEEDVEVEEDEIKEKEKIEEEAEVEENQSDNGIIGRGIS